MSPVVAQALAVALAASAVAQEAAPPPRDHNAPPPGTAADQQLWRDLRGATNAAVLHLARIGQCAYRIGYGRYYQGLDAIAADEAAPDREEARALRGRLEAEAKAAQDSVPAAPRTRECQYTLRDLDVSMPLAASDRRAARMLKAARAEGKRCVARLAPAAEAWKRHADRLDETLAAADALATRRGTSLHQLGAPPPPGEAPAASPQGKP